MTASNVRTLALLSLFGIAPACSADTNQGGPVSPAPGMPAPGTPAPAATTPGSPASPDAANSTLAAGAASMSTEAAPMGAEGSEAPQGGEPGTERPAPPADAPPDSPVVTEARTLVKARRAGTRCESDATLSAIVSKISNGVSDDPTMAMRLVGDPDFSELSGSVAWRRLIWGANDAGQLVRLLGGATYYSPPAGVIGSDQILEFGPEGQGYLRTRGLGEGGEVQEDRQPVEWSVSGEKISVMLPSGTQTLSLDEQGNLMEGNTLAWLDLPSECGA